MLHAEASGLARHRGTGRSGSFQNPPPKSPAARLRTAGPGYPRPAPPVPARVGNPGARGPDHHPGPASAAGPDGTDGQRRDSAAAPATGPRATIRTRQRPAPPVPRQPGPWPRHARSFHPACGNPVLESGWEKRAWGRDRTWERFPTAEYRILYLSREVGVRPEIGTPGTAPPGDKPWIGGERSGLYSRPCRRPVPLHLRRRPVRDSGGERKQGGAWKIRRPILSPGLYSRPVGTLLARLGLIPGTLLA